MCHISLNALCNYGAWPVYVWTIPAQTYTILYGK